MRPRLDGRRFDGAGYDPAQDQKRLEGQIARVFNASYNHWRTLFEIREITGDPESSISAQLRHLKKKRFGSWTLEKRRRADGSGTWEYRISDPVLEGLPLFEGQP